MAKLVNLARMSTATTGTGVDITLGSAVAGYLSFSAAGVGSGNIVSYGIRDGNNSEVGIGSVSGSTFSRSTVVASTNGGSRIDLSGSAEVFITALAHDLLPQPGRNGGRLTLQSGVAVPTTNQTAKTTLYWTPYLGNQIALYEGGTWHTVASGQVSMALSATSADTNYDVYGYRSSSGGLALELLAWSSATARATALTTQDGVLVKSGDVTRRYLGTIRTTGTAGQCEDSMTKRFVWNAQNRTKRPLQCAESTASWTYSTTSYRQVNANTSNQVELVCGLAESLVWLTAVISVTSSTTTTRTALGAIGLDSTTAAAADCSPVQFGVNSNARINGVASYSGHPGVGYHYLAWLERGGGADTQTWYANNTGGLMGWCEQ